MTLDSYRDQVYSCLRCGFCFDLPAEGNRRICPPYCAHGFESYGARGKLAAARALLDGELELDAEVANRLYACTECGACESQCFKYLPLSEIYRAMKERVVELGWLPEVFQSFADAVKEQGNPYSKAGKDRLAWLPDRRRVGGRASVLLFSGCTPSYLRRGIARSAFQVLEALGSPFTLLADEQCCGHPFLSLGLVSQARAAAERNLEAILGSGAETVVTPCPGCLKTFRVDMPLLLKKKLPFEVLHLTEYVAREMERGGVHFRRNPGLVTYHDPCNLGRGLGVYDAPRRVATAAPGVRLVEMPRARQAAFCCGHGGFVRAVDLDVAKESAADRWAEAVGTGAEAVLSACPACETAFLEARASTGSPVEVLDIVEFLARAL